MEDAPRVPRKLSAGSSPARAIRAAFRCLWFAVIPALLAIISVRYLVPSTVDVGLTAFEERLAEFGAEHPVEIGAALFVLFALLVRAWRSFLPGGRYLSALPLPLVLGTPEEHFSDYEAAAELHETLLVVLLRRNSRRHLSSEQRRDLIHCLDDLAEVLESGSPARVEEERASVADAGAALLASRQRAEGLSVALGIIAAALLALTLKASVFGTYRVLSGSMLPTFRPNDHVGVNKLSYGFRSAFGSARAASRMPRRGDVIVFSRDEGDGYRDQVKRVIGVPGDHVKMDGLFPVINGWTLPSCNVGPYAYVSAGKRSSGRMRVEWLEDRAYLVLFGLSAPDFDREYVVQPGEVFVLGDNRSDSRDSRSYNSGFGGGAEIATIEGRVDWFLYGMKNNGSVSLRRLLAPLGTEFSLEGLSVDLLERRIQACLAKRPKETRPPPAPEAWKGSASL